MNAFFHSKFLLFICFSLIFIPILHPDLKTKENPIQPIISPKIHVSTSSNEVAKIVVDISHGYEVFIPAKASTMGGLLEGTKEFQVISTTMKQQINDSILADADVFVIMSPDPNLNYSNDEIQSVKKFWQNKGSLLLVGALTFGESARSNSELNKIVDALGFNLSFATAQEPVTKIETNSPPTHDTMYNLNSFLLLGTSITINDETNIQILTRGNNKKVNFAVFENETHRAAFLGSNSPLNEHRDYEDDDHRDDHYQFQYNLMNWLSYNPPKALEDYLPIKVYSGVESPNSITDIKKLPFYQGMCHFHTAISNVNAPYPEMADALEELNHDFVIVTDYNTVAGGPALRDYFQSKHIDDIIVIDGEEATENLYHTVGWFEKETATDILGVLNPLEKIELFHDQNSPAFLAHPSWLITPDYPRVWDHDLYPFDGYEPVNSGWLQGNGNLAVYPFYGATDSHSAELYVNDGLGMVWNYVFTDNISESPDWWTEALFDRKVVIYSHLGDYYFGDKLLVDEIVGRLNDEDPPVITIVSPISVTQGKQTTFTAVITDASQISEVKLTVMVDGILKGTFKLQSDQNNYSLFNHDLGTFSEEESVKLVLSASDSLDYSSTSSVELTIQKSSDSSSSSSTSNASSGSSLIIVLAGMAILIVYRIRTKKQ